ncbi:MAG: hypothetical protein R2857_14765 [Vampirovibrionales bacterium]
MNDDVYFKGKATFGSVGNSSLNGSRDEDDVTIAKAENMTIDTGRDDDIIKVDQMVSSKVTGGDGYDEVHVKVSRNSYVYGGEGNDTIYLDASDKLSSGSTYYGDNGNDKYVLSKDHQFDTMTLHGGGGTNILEIQGYTREQVKVERINGSTAHFYLTLPNGSKMTVYSVQEFQFDDGPVAYSELLDKFDVGADNVNAEKSLKFTAEDAKDFMAKALGDSPNLSRAGIQAKLIHLNKPSVDADPRFVQFLQSLQDEQVFADIAGVKVDQLTMDTVITADQFNKRLAKDGYDRDFTAQYSEFDVPPLPVVEYAATDKSAYSWGDPHYVTYTNGATVNWHGDPTKTDELVMYVKESHFSLGSSLASWNGTADTVTVNQEDYAIFNTEKGQYRVVADPTNKTVTMFSPDGTQRNLVAGEKVDFVFRTEDLFGQSGDVDNRVSGFVQFDANGNGLVLNAGTTVNQITFNGSGQQSYTNIRTAPTELLFQQKSNDPDGVLNRSDGLHGAQFNADFEAFDGTKLWFDTDNDHTKDANELNVDFKDYIAYLPETDAQKTSALYFAAMEAFDRVRG